LIKKKKKFYVEIQQIKEQSAENSVKRFDSSIPPKFGFFHATIRELKEISKKIYGTILRRIWIGFKEESKGYFKKK
jgi:hypothetical protein